ncbi:tRNA (adenosine(37)-N6)-threonylcarbamoyltransferase complex dimerization subunit type 1 TsaB [Prolixibacter sp. SD074]|uniref:tRNA (adenosine(37)-N6)-threonylcarbamoyltransferase complex dimerization subunit type 1 TsaB n=1 Tax=Prolixibacter sp. SD074 TaxID=2652391 RepID=UPI001E30126F|nr:tRNA (adenosine(37)-N6)-threonylcarbamoyltransferase complex dimerization subunit type 1 TsaB [Prolixibacter sp. SD074]
MVPSIHSPQRALIKPSKKYKRYWHAGNDTDMKNLPSLHKIYSMPLILNLESSTEVCSVSVAKDGNVLAFRENSDGMNHAKLLTLYAEEVLNELKLNAADLDAVAVSGGPGSYTGLRIGVSAAKGICYAAGLPLIAISSLESMAAHVALHLQENGLPTNEPLLLCPMIDARRMEVYSALFSTNGEQVRDITADVIDHHSFEDYLQKGPVAFFGNGADKCKRAIQHPNALFPKGITASSKHMTALAEKAFSEKNFVDVAYYEPFYLKDFVATVPRKNIFGNQK